MNDCGQCTCLDKNGAMTHGFHFKIKSKLVVVVDPYRPHVRGTYYLEFEKSRKPGYNFGKLQTFADRYFTFLNTPKGKLEA